MTARGQVLSEIRRTAASNNGVPLGSRRFASETGMKEHDWQKYWPRWGDALLEAGFSPNEWQGAYEKNALIGKLIELAIKLGKAPTYREIQVEHHRDKSFPDKKTFSRLGTRRELAGAAVKYCADHEIDGDVVQMFSSLLSPEVEGRRSAEDVPAEDGYVYLIKSGRYYKIGKSNSAGRREYELSIQLPEKPKTIHIIKTDDPTGIEAYWHRRFDCKRKGGEWFDLDSSDVKAFKRRKFM
jgi:hypothetical protein